MPVLSHNDSPVNLYDRCMHRMLLMFHRTKRKLFVPENGKLFVVQFVFYRMGDLFICMLNVNSHSAMIKFECDDQICLIKEYSIQFHSTLNWIRKVFSLLCSTTEMINTVTTFCSMVGEVNKEVVEITTNCTFFKCLLFGSEV